MKLITFTESSRTRIGLLQDGQIVDLSTVAPSLPDDMLNFLEAGDAAMQEAAKHINAAAHFAAVREAVGPDIKLLIDCHGRFTVTNCIRLARALEACNLYVFEDPVPPEDLNAYPKVRQEISIPVMGSERLNTKSHYRQLLDLNGIDIAQPDLMNAGRKTEHRNNEYRTTRIEQRNSALENRKSKLENIKPNIESQTSNTSLIKSNPRQRNPKI